MNYEQRTINLIEFDQLRMRALCAARSLNLPDWLISAGFVRNAIWNDIYANDTELNDIDVIYFCLLDTSDERDFLLEQQLIRLEPELPWSVKNQARMHFKNGDSPYKDTLDAMSYWPEKQTSIGVFLNDNDRVVVCSSFDLALNFNNQINRNPTRSIEVFNNRVNSKNWIELWPMLKIVP